jgi:hypothetical protein
MKQTIAELGIGGEGWIIYDGCFSPKRVVHIVVVNEYDEDTDYLMPRYVLREETKTINGTSIFNGLIVFGNHIVYSAKEEAEEELENEISRDTVAHFCESEQLNKENSALNQGTLKDVDWKKLADELGRIQKQFEDATEDQKKDACTFIKKLRNIVDPQPDDINWKQVRIDASISILNSLLETTKHSVLEEAAVNEVYAKTAVAYADALVKELKRSEALFEEKLKEI